MEKLEGKSMDIVGENIIKLKELFPEVFCEDKIDFERLQEVLGEYVEDKEERYRFEWKGKSKAIRIAQTQSTGTLRPCKEESKNWDSTENLYIEGDNLEVLKLLQKTYNNKIKMIYIDPPYNTGNDFVYPDDYRDNMKNYLEITGQVDDEGRKVGTNSEASGRYHTDWLNMMYSRLRLARNLLSDDGIIFISIDDNEGDNLRKVCDEVFGEESFIAKIIWEKRITRENRRYISVRHDYILVYAKKSSLISQVVGLLPMNKEAIDRYKNPDNDSRGVWTSVPAIAQAGHGTKNQFYILKTPSGKMVNPPSGSCWRYTQERMYEEISKNRIWFGKDGNGVPRIKKFLTEGRQGLTPETMWFAKEVETNDTAKRMLVELFDGISVFDTPKPIQLIKRMLQIGTEDNNIILDFFSGTATTAHSVMQLNAEDNGSRKFIMVQLPEECDEKSEAYKAGYRNICKIGKERIRRAGEKIKEENKDKKGIENLDVGFKVFKLDSSNIKKWNPNHDNLEIALDDMINNFVPERTEEDVLYEIMLKYGIDLTYPVEITEINGKKVFSIGFGALFVCLDNEITLDVVEGIVKLRDKLQPEITRVVFKDNGFKNDEVKTNAVQILRRNKIKEIISI